MSTKLKFSGIIPANLLPFNKDYSIHEKDYRRHLSWLANVKGVTAIVCNGHAAEVSSLTREERKRALEIAVDEVGSRIPLISGIYSDSTLEAMDLSKDAKAEGASGLLIFPPLPFMWGAQLRPEMVYRHFAAIAETAGLPMVVFQFPPATGIGYSTETLVKLAEIPQVVGIKEYSNDMVVFESNLRAIRATGKPVAILSSYSSSLLSTFILGADGAISGMGSVAADLQAQLFDEVQKGDLRAARKINDRLDLLVRVFYARPALDQHNRMKEALAMLGRISQAVVRPPLQPIGEEERSKICLALKEAGLLAS